MLVINVAAQANNYTISVTTKIRSVATRFGRNGMSLPASNDTGTVFCFPN